MILKVDENGMITLPEEIIEKFELREGDKVNFKALENGSIEMTFPKKVDMNLDLTEEEMFELMKMAHKQDITLNKLIEDVLSKYIDKSIVTVAKFESDFDDIIARVEAGNTIIICEDMDEEPIAVIMPYAEYEAKTV